MPKSESIMAILAIVGVAWVILSRNSNPNSIAVSSPAPSVNVPWYLNYNTTPPFLNQIMATLPEMSVGIENTSDQTCPGCSMFGVAYGSQY